MRTILQVVGVVGAVLTTLVAVAQDPRFGGPGGPGGPGDHRYSEDEIKSRVERTNSFLQQLDRNGNGVLEPDEVSGDQRRMAEYIFSRAGVELRLPMPVATLRQGVENYYRGRSANAPPGSPPFAPGSPGSSFAPPGSPSRPPSGPPSGPPQPPPGGPPGDPRSRGSSDHRYSEEEIKSRLERTDTYLRQLDKNNNGVLDPDEVTGDQRRMAEYLFGRAGMELKLPMPVATLRKAVEDYYRGRAAGTSSAFAGFGPVLSSTASAFSGFTLGMSPQTAIAGFGAALTATTAVTASASKAAPPSSSNRTSPTALYQQLDREAQQRVRDLATAVMRKYDKNTDSRLTKDEWPGDNHLGTFDEANRTGGSVISFDELLMHFADYYKQGKMPSSPEGGGSSRSSSSAARTKSGRFLSASERLPKGLPRWFLDKIDADGQIMMSEFTRDWTPETAALFERFDLNHDGIITAEECLKVEKPSR